MMLGWVWGGVVNDVGLGSGRGYEGCWAGFGAEL